MIRIRKLICCEGDLNHGQCGLLQYPIPDDLYMHGQKSQIPKQSSFSRLFKSRNNLKIEI